MTLDYSRNGDEQPHNEDIQENSKTLSTVSFGIPKLSTTFGRKGKGDMGIPEKFDRFW